MVEERIEPDGFKKSVSVINLIVREKYAGLRLDQYLALNLPDVSRSLISASIKSKIVLVDDTIKKNSYRLKAGQRVTGTIEGERDLVVLPEKIPFEILYEDDSLLLLSKPPGLVVHPGSGNTKGTLVNGLLYHCKTIEKVGESIRPGIVHRLDKDTSGLMVVAKRADVHSLLVDLFKDHRLTKEYLALVCGIPKESQGRIVAPIGRHPVQRQKMAVVDHGGKHAVTNWRTVASFGNQYTLLRVNIETGRTHQIRVHMAHLGFPIAGDKIYGRAKQKNNFPRQMLHAWRLSFTHPVSGEMVNGKAQVWQDFQEALNGLGGENVLEEL